MVTHQLQVRCRPVKVRRSETDVLPLSHPTNMLGMYIVQVSAGDGREVSAIVCPSRYLLTAGWSRVVRVYSDVPGRDDDDDGKGDCAGCVDQWEMVHGEDIMCMALLRPTTVVTASYDGDMVVWSLDNGRALACFNADLHTGSLQSSRQSTYRPTSTRRRRTMYV